MNFDEARDLIGRSKRVTFFTGAGISAESGVPTFRTAKGLWETYDPDEFASVGGIARNIIFHPTRVVGFLYDFLDPIVNATPNAAHFAIAELAKRKEISVVTQNVDGLHQRSGSENVFELHGSIYQSRCLLSGGIDHLNIEDLQTILHRLAVLRDHGANVFSIFGSLAPAARFDLMGIWLPHLVLFGQALPSEIWDRSIAAVKQCDCLIVVGSSLTVYPAASLVTIAVESGKSIIQVDPYLENEDCVTGFASTVLPKVCV
jgi:NAD-dependent deacetylase